MKLAVWLRQQHITHAAFAERFEPPRRRETVLRWCKGHTTPDMADITAIERLTEGAVTATDWAEQYSSRTNLSVLTPAANQERA